ncbi:S8 family serine peptidase [Bacteroides sp. 51]|uniref:S8 family serine peptidase n=1 Tax=Bacteroides sp. 51 TaxID=2302938 RepID=UPI0013D4A3BF|nr:S8 family serine peptidase [Bacteroides sp. 51]NDV83822.1 peptidase [Bacteroides sp. 51]
MRKILSILSIALFLALNSCSEHPAEYTEPVPEPKVDMASLSGRQVQAGRLIVKLKEEPSSTEAFTRASGIDIRKMERVFPHAGEFEERSRAAGLHLWYVVEYDESVATTRAAGELSLLDNVSVIEPVIPVRKTGSGTFRKFNEGEIAQFKQTSENYIFNDAYTYAQWNFENNGSLEGSLAGADIRLFDAWEFTTGHPDVIVCVVDGGIDYAHEDLAANMWVNKAEQNGVDSHDDDANGYADDIYGFNFVTGKAIEPTLHGSHVAGIIGAVNNNHIGVSGIAGGDGTPDSGVRLMNCQIYLDNEEGEKSATNYYAAAAIKYGADNGAVISQNSWGFDVGTVSATPQLIQEAIAYFITNAGMDKSGNQVGPMKGGLVVFAAGNDDVMIPTFPASDDNVISVAAMGFNYKRGTYSNYGSTVDIVAPGGEIGFSASAGILSTCGGWNGSGVVTNAYYYMDGTSMACPHVSGVAALLISKYGVEQRGLTPAQLKEMLYASVYDISAYNPGYQGMLGIGALDASKAFLGGVIIPPTPPVLLKPLPDLAFYKTNDSRTLTLSDYFASTQADRELTFRISTISNLVSLTLTDNQLKISSVGYGKSSVTVTAVDSSGLETEAILLVSCYSRTVRPDRPGFWTEVNDLE